MNESSLFSSRVLVPAAWTPPFFPSTRDLHDIYSPGMHLLKIPVSYALEMSSSHLLSFLLSVAGRAVMNSQRTACHTGLSSPTLRAQGNPKSQFCAPFHSQMTAFSTLDRIFDFLSLGVSIADHLTGLALLPWRDSFAQKFPQ